MPFTNGQLQPKSHFTSYHAKKGCHSLHDGLPAVTTSRFNESSNSSLHDMRGSDFVSPSLFHTTSTGSEVLHALDTSSTIQGLSGLSNSSNALSLLSSQSQGSSNHSTVFSASRPLIQPSNNYNVTQASKNVLGLGPQASAGRMSSTFNSSGVNSAEGGLDQILFPSNTCGINRIIQGSDLVNPKNQLSCEDGPTIDLLQLSSQLQRVEHQRFSMQVKQDSNAFPGLRITWAGRKMCCITISVLLNSITCFISVITERSFLLLASIIISLAVVSAYVFVNWIKNHFLLRLSHS